MTSKPKLHIIICMGSSCYSRGNTGSTIDIIRDATENEGYEPEISGHLCENQCTNGPHLTLDGIVYSDVQPSCIPELIRYHITTQRKTYYG